MDPNEIISQNTAPDTDESGNPTGKQLTTIQYRDGRKIVYKHSPNEDPITGTAVKSTVDPGFQRAWQAEQKLAKGANPTIRRNAKGQLVQVDSSGNEKVIDESTTPQKPSIHRNAVGQLVQTNPDGTTEIIDENTTPIKETDAQRQQREAAAQEQAARSGYYTGLQSEVPSRIAQSNAQTALAQQSLANNWQEQQRQRLATLVSLGQMDQSKAEKELQALTTLSGQIFQNAQWNVPEGSEFFPGMGPGSAYERYTGHPARTGGTFDPIQRAQQALGLQGPPQIPGMDQALQAGTAAANKYAPGMLNASPPPTPQSGPSAPSGGAPTLPPYTGPQESGQGYASPEMLKRVAAQAGLTGEGEKALQAVMKTEGAPSGQVGDSGQSFGPFQFHVAGMLPDFAKYLGVAPDQAAKVAQSNPEVAMQYAVNGYLGQAIKDGLAKGLSGPDLAIYAQQNGQRSQSPERAGANYTSLFGGQ